MENGMKVSGTKEGIKARIRDISGSFCKFSELKQGLDVFIMWG
jgi:hypothetical protein